MKRKLHIIYVSLAVLLILFSCVKEFVNNKSQQGKFGDNNTLTVEEARAFFESFVTTFSVVSPTAIGAPEDKQPLCAPVWSKGKAFTLDDKPFVEVPLSPGLISISRHNPAEPISDGERYNNSVIRLIAQKTDEGEILYYIATFTADDQMLITRGFKVRNMSLSNLSNFSGKVVYQNTSGEFIGGLIFKTGRQVGVVKFGNDDSKNPDLPGSQNTRVMTSNGGCYTYIDRLCWDEGDSYRDDGFFTVKLFLITAS